MHWLRAIITTVVWGFLLTGLAGLLEAAVYLVSQGVVGPPHPLGSSGFLLAALTLGGWFGGVVALLALGPLALVLGRRRGGTERAVALALAAGPALFGAILVGSLLQDRLPGLWWRAHLGTLWLPKLALAAVLTLSLGLLLRRLAGWLQTLSLRWQLAPLLLVVLATASWPDWRGMARRDQLGDLPTAVRPDGSDHVVILSIDTLRRDKLGCLDPDAPSTPNLDALAAAGHLFTNAWSVSSWTLPAMATVMTGQPPRTLGLRRYTALPDGVPTLAELAWRAGWWTAAVVANPYLVPEYGFARGFADYDHSDIVEPLTPAAASVLAREATRYVIGSTEPSDGRRLVESAIAWLDRRPQDRPFLLWLHFMEPHVPYRAHPDPQGQWPTLPDHPLLSADRFENMDGVREALPDVPLAVRQAIERLHDGEIEYVDACVGRLVAALERRGLLDDSWLVVLSDHGEEFFEHGGYEHGHSLMPEVTGVPLIIRPPGGLTAGTRNDRRVGLLDLLPSLAGRLGWEVPSDLPGRACLLPVAEDQDRWPAQLTVLENMLYGPPQQATLRWPDLRIVELESGRSLWFALDEDPGAQDPRPAPGDAPQLRERQRELLADWDDRARALGAADRADAPLSESARRRLRSLGY